MQKLSTVQMESTQGGFLLVLAAFVVGLAAGYFATNALLDWIAPNKN